MGTNNQAVSKESFKSDNTNVTKVSDYQTLDLTGSDAYAKAKAANDESLAAYTTAAMGSATAQGLENVYGSENSYGALGAGNSGAASAAQARGMAAPIAQANTNIAQMSAEQNSKLMSDYTGVVAPTYQQQASEADVIAANNASNGS